MQQDQHNYQLAKAQLLGNGIAPAETPNNCCFSKLPAPHPSGCLKNTLRYAFCCCLCTSKTKPNTKENFMMRF